MTNTRGDSFTTLLIERYFKIQAINKYTRIFFFAGIAAVG